MSATLPPPLPFDAYGSRRTRMVNGYLARVSRPFMSAVSVGSPQLRESLLRAARPGINRSIASMSPVPERTRTLAVREPFGGASVRGEWVVPQGSARTDEQIIYFLHGSGYVICSPRTHRGLVARLGRRCWRAAFSLDYRLGPEHRWPAAGDDAIRGYRWLLAQGYEARNIAIAGDSAGGHLALDLLAANHADGVDQPGAMVLFSPLYDPSFELAVANQRRGARDPFIEAVSAQKMMRLYTGGAAADEPRMRVRLTDDIHLPPTLIQYGSLEVMGDDAREYHRAYQAAGGEAEIQCWPDQGHVFQLFPGISPEGRRAVSVAAEFIARHSPR